MDKLKAVIITNYGFFHAELINFQLQVSIQFKENQIREGFNTFPLLGPCIVAEFEENIIVYV